MSRGGMAPIWDNSPDTLMNLCTQFCVENLNSICDKDPHTNAYYLRKGVSLPAEICEQMVKAKALSTAGLDDAFLFLFKNKESTRLRRISVQNAASVTDDGLAAVFNHKLFELEISNCPQITEETLNHINSEGSELISLTVGSTTRIFPESLYPEEETDTESASAPVSGSSERTMQSKYTCRGYILQAPLLRRLVIHDLCVPLEQEYFAFLLQPLCRLTHLDLSGCYFLGSLSYLMHLKQLVSLVLFDVPKLNEVMPAICQLKTLRHLDISQHSEKRGTFCNPNQVLTQIVENLSELSSLDISGTNLGGPSTAEPISGKENGDADDVSLLAQPVIDIPGLRSRVNRPLDFLGLLGTSNDACHRSHIPAKRVTGNANESQILTAAQAYVDRSEVLQKCLNELFQILRFETCHDPRLALEVILTGMGRHLLEKHIQIAGSASLFYIVKSEEKHYFNVKIKRIIIKTILDAMWEHEYDTTMMRNGCLTLCHFRIPQDVLFDYERLVKILLHIVSAQEDHEDFVQRIGIYLLNSLACQVDGVQKELVGNLGAIDTMLNLIEKRLNRQICDEVMEMAWSTMWNVTDETAINCQRFLDGKGMDYFLGCLRAFPDRPELLRNMMGLLGNVAEVRTLRHRIMTREYINVFSELLDSTSDGIEVSYNAAGVISHLASDGLEMWTMISPSREEVLQRMVTAIENWNLSTRRNINYRSFEPILRLLGNEHTPQAQHWATWALANLTFVYPDKYCPLVEEEGGLELLRELLQRNSPYQRIKELAKNVIVHCIWYHKFGTLDELKSLYNAEGRV